MSDPSKEWILRHKESELYMQMDRGIDFWTHEIRLATGFITRKEAIETAKKIGLNKQEYEIV